jgi:hypothetical protein
VCGYTEYYTRMRIFDPSVTQGDTSVGENVRFSICKRATVCAVRNIMHKSRAKHEPHQRSKAQGTDPHETAGTTQTSKPQTDRLTQTIQTKQTTHQAGRNKNKPVAS